VSSLFGAYTFAAENAVIWIIASYGAYLLFRAGIFAVPQVGFMAIGAFASGVWTTRVSNSIVVGAIFGAIFAAVVGIALGFLLRRLAGIYLAIATIAFVVVVQILCTNFSITGGALGLIGIPLLPNGNSLLITLGAVIVLMIALSYSWAGRAMDVLREQSVVAAHFGVNVGMYRVALFGVSGLLGGLAGALLGNMAGFIQPGQFGFSSISQIVAVVVIGGTFRALGPLIGGVIVFGLPEVVTSLGAYATMIDGVLLLVVVVAVPGGVASLPYLAVGVVRRWRERRRVDIATLSPASSNAPSTAVGSTLTPEDETASSASSVGDILMTLQSVSHSYGGVTALDDVSFDIRRGEVLGLIGPNGSGKTTLLNVVSGAIRPRSGSIIFESTDMARMLGRPDRIARAGVVRTFQNIRLVPSMSARENVAFGAYRRAPRLLVSFSWAKARRATSEIRSQTSSVFATDRWDLPSPNARVSGLPYGTQRQLEIERALAARPKLFLLDEPAAGMTPTERAHVFGRLRELAHAGVTIVVIEHDLESLRMHCDRIAVLNFGHLLTIGEPDQVATSPEVAEAYLGV